MLFVDFVAWLRPHGPDSLLLCRWEDSPQSFLGQVGFYVGYGQSIGHTIESLPFKPDFVIPVLNHYQRPSFHSPLAYAGALRALRWAIQTPWTSRLLTPMEAQGYTLHSLKVTFLSAAAQLRLPSRARRLQGHHVQGSMQLYSRDDTVDAVWLQQEICKQVRGGWRPTRPLQRGGQPPVPEPPFQVPERLHPEHFDIAPEPELAMFQATDHFLEDIEPISLADSTSSSDSSSSCSDSEEEAPAPREIQRTLESMHFVSEWTIRMLSYSSGSSSRCSSWSNYWSHGPNIDHQMWSLSSTFSHDH